jgi:hypothetical protein
MFPRDGVETCADVPPLERFVHSCVALNASDSSDVTSWPAVAPLY